MRLAVPSVGGGGGGGGTGSFPEKRLLIEPNV